jgi:hypothetical protein
MKQIDMAWCRDHRAKPLIAGGIILLASGVLHLGIYLCLQGPWEGPVSWRKPILFGISAGLTSISMGWVWSNLSKYRSDSFFSWATALALVVEVGLIDLQQWRGVPSHFNRTTTLDSNIYNVMGILILGVTGVILMLTVRSFTNEVTQPTPMVIAMQSGLVYLAISCILGVLINISGDLRVQEGLLPARYGQAGVPKFPHGVVIHALQWLPVIAWLTAKAKFGMFVQRQMSIVASAATGLLLIYASIVTLLGRARFDAPVPLAIVFYIAVLLFVSLGAVIIVGLLIQDRNPTQTPQ